jgi:hypothetical protein
MKYVSFLLLLAGCTQSNQNSPRMVSSARHQSYVEDYPATMEATMKAAVDHETHAKATIEAMPAYTKELKGADAARVLSIVNAADESGRSIGYVQRARELSATSAFFEEEREPLTRRITGAAQSKLKEKDAQCTDADIGGTVSYALKDGIERQVERRLRDRNEAHAILDHYRASLGKDNVADMEKQADAIAQASYTVYVALLDDRARLGSLLAERSDVASSIDRVLEEERVYAAEKARTDVEKKASADRTAALMKGKATLRAFTGDAEKLVKSLDEQIPQFQKSYEDVLKLIRTQLTPAR